MNKHNSARTASMISSDFLCGKMLMLAAEHIGAITERSLWMDLKISMMVMDCGIVEKSFWCWIWIHSVGRESPAPPPERFSHVFW